MKVLMLSTDKNILDVRSAAYSRMLEYGSLFDELHVVVAAASTIGPAVVKASEKVFIYSAASHFRLGRFWRAYKIAAQILIQQAAEKDWVVTAQDPFESGLIGFWLKKKFSLPLQLQIHTDFLSPYFGVGFINRARVFLAKCLVPRADGLRVVSERIRQSIIDRRMFLASRVVVLPIFVDTRCFEAGGLDQDAAESRLEWRAKYPEKNFIILMASRLTSEKNIAMAISAMREALAGFPRALLLIVGEGPERARLIRQAAKYHLENSVVFDGWTDDLFPYYRGADLFLLTSNYEGYGRTLVEAAACGLPTVSTDVGIAREVLPSSCVASVGDASQLAAILKRAIANYSRVKIDCSAKAGQFLKRLPLKGVYLERWRSAVTNLVV